jgi:hypothetical protein
MKYLILCLGFLLISATNYIPENKGNVTYWLQEDCEKQSGQRCYPFDSSEDLEIMLVKQIEIDDYDKPIYAARTNETDCKLYETQEYPIDDCRAITQKVDIGIPEIPDYVYLLCTDKSYFAIFALKSDFGLGEGYFAYCTKITGYQKKTIKTLVENSQLKADKEVRVAQELLEKQQKEQLITEARQKIKDAKGKIKNLSKSELDALIEQLLIMLDN